MPKITKHFQATRTARNSRLNKLDKKDQPGSREKEESSLADAPISASDKVKDLELLKQFDLNLEFGPCTGITRLERWERAEKHELSPPAEVKDILLEHADDEVYSKCIWNDYEI